MHKIYDLNLRHLGNWDKFKAMILLMYVSEK